MKDLDYKQVSEKIYQLHPYSPLIEPVKVHFPKLEEQSEGWKKVNREYQQMLKDAGLKTDDDE